MVNSHDLVEECLANIHRHSGSRTARISISSVDHHLFVQVSDAGKGAPLVGEQSELNHSTRTGVGFRA